MSEQQAIDIATKPETTGSGSGPVFAVEARCTGAPEQAGNGQIFDGEWRRVQFDRGPIGVPDQSFFARFCALPSGYYGHDAAMALAWWFKAANQWGFKVRIKGFRFEHSHSVTDTGKAIELDPEPAAPSQNTSGAAK